MDMVVLPVEGRYVTPDRSQNTGPRGQDRAGPVRHHPVSTPSAANGRAGLIGEGTTMTGNKSAQSKQQSLERKQRQQQRGSKSFKGGSNVHNGGSQGQSGQPKK
jgi:hypothetical protein